MVTRTGRTTVRPRRLATVLTLVALLAALAPGGAGAAEGPTGTLTGAVRDAATGEPVGDAWIVVMSAHDVAPVAEAVAGGDGGFSVEVPGGSYFLYLIDPTGTYRSGFAGAPDLVEVRHGEAVDVAAAMAPALGTLEGVVTDAPSGSPIGGAWVVVLGASGAPERAVRTGADGRYRIEALTEGPRKVAFVDPTASHVAGYHPGVTNVSEAGDVDVVAGTTAVAGAALARQSTFPAFSSLMGTVSDSRSGAPVDDVLVLALRAGDLRFAGASSTGANGRYRVSLPLGTYKLAFLQTTGTHAMEWHQNQPFHGIASAASVWSPGSVNASLDPTTGVLQGAVRDEATGDPVQDAWVVSLGPDGRIRGAVTDADGEFSAAGLPAGTYRAAFLDPTGDHELQYWDGQPDFVSADTFDVAPGGPTAIEGNLKAPPAPGLLDEAIGWWEASTGLSGGALPDLSGHGRDLRLHEGFAPSYPPALVAPDPARGRHLFSPGWDDMYLDTPDPTRAITGIDVAWDGDLNRVLEVAAWKDINWLVHQGDTEVGSLGWAVGVVAATGQVEARWSADGSTVSSVRSSVAFPTGPQRGAVTVDPATGALTVYRQDPGSSDADFDRPYTDPAWEVIDHVPGTGPVVVHDSDAAVRHSSAIPRDRIGDSTGEGWFESLYALRVRAAPGAEVVAAFDVDLVPAEPEWFLETGLPPLFPHNEYGEASSTHVPGVVGETWTIHNYTTSSYPMLLVDRPYVIFGNHSFASVDVADGAFEIEPGEDLSVWVAYSYPRIGSGGGPLVALKDWSPDASAPGWALLSSPFFAGPSAVVSDGTQVAYDPALPVTDSRLNVSGFQVDGDSRTIRSYSNAAPTAAPVSIAGLGPLSPPDARLTVAGYSDNGTQGPSFAFAALVVFDRTLTPDEIDRLPEELGLVAG